MAKRGKRFVTGIPLIDKFEEGDCAAGGYHEDLPFVCELPFENGEKVVEFFCLKCKFVHWAIFSDKKAEVELPKAEMAEPTFNDDNPIFDGLPHA